MKRREIENPVGANVLVYNHGKEPSDETVSKIMDFIEQHKEETMALTEDSLPTPDEQMRRRHALTDPENDSIWRKDDDSGSEGEPVKGC